MEAWFGTETRRSPPLSNLFHVANRDRGPRFSHPERIFPVLAVRGVRRTASGHGEHARARVHPRRVPRAHSARRVLRAPADRTSAMVLVRGVVVRRRAGVQPPALLLAQSAARSTGLVSQIGVRLQIPNDLPYARTSRMRLLDTKHSNDPGA